MAKCESTVLGLRSKKEEVSLPLFQHPLFMWIKEAASVNLSFSFYRLQSIPIALRNEVPGTIVKTK